MAAVHFYHLTTTPLERALPKLLEKCYASGQQTLLLARDDEQVEKLNQLLWAYDQDSFLPHGSIKDGNAEKHPILLASDIPEHAAGRKILFITNGVAIENVDARERIIDMFDGSREESLQAARVRWKQYKEKALELFYYQQTSNGNWEKKAN